MAAALRSLPLFEVDADASQFRMMRVDGLHGSVAWSIATPLDPVAACKTAIQHINDLR